MAGVKSFLADHRRTCEQRKQPPPAHRQAPAAPADAGDYSVLAAACKQDADHLKATYPDDYAARNRAKGTLLDKYRDYLNGWMAAGHTHQNDVLVYNAMWALDSESWEWMQELVSYAVATHQVITWTKRNLPTLVADTLVQSAEARFKDGDKQMESVFWWAFGEVANWPLTAKNIILAHYHKLAGHIRERDKACPDALHHYRQADTLKPDIGVKTRIKDLEKRAPPAQPATPAATATGNNNPMVMAAGVGTAVLGENV